MSTIDKLVAVAIRSHELAVRRFRAACRRVARAGDHPYSDLGRSRASATLDRAESECDREALALARTRREAIEALTTLATANGLSIGPEPVGIKVGRTLWVVSVPLGSDGPELVQVKLDRSIGL